MPEKYYWGEISQAEMVEINNLAASKGWRFAIDTILKKRHPGLVSMVTAEDRVDWAYLLGHKKLSVLDVGSGWGQSSYLLAARFGHSVTSLELIPERVRFQTIRAKEAGLSNIKVLTGSILDPECGQDWGDEQFDLATFIGVLEWVGVSQIYQNPRDVQLQALKNVHKVLRPGGKLVVGIENRIGFNNILGAKDHSGFSFTSLMPRTLASFYLSIRNSKYRSNTFADSYRTYTYTANGYKKLLKESGFKNIRLFVSHPHYAHPRSIIPADNSSIRNFFWNSYTPGSFKDSVFFILFRFLSMVGMGSLLAPHFIIFADK